MSEERQRRKTEGQNAKEVGRALHKNPPEFSQWLSHQSLSGLPGRSLNLWALEDLLHAPSGDLADHDLVVVSAIHGMDRAKFLQLLARFAEFAQDGPVELQPVNFAAHLKCVRIVVVRVGVGTVKILMRSGSDAEGPRSADVVVH